MSAGRWVTLATRRLEKYGRASPAAVVHVEASAYSPNQSEASYTTTTTYVNAAPVDKRAMPLPDNTVTTHDKWVYTPNHDVDGNSFIPVIGDTIQLESVYRIVEVVGYETESVVCAYMLRVVV